MATTLAPTTSQPTATRIPGTAIPCYQFDTHEELARCVAQTFARVIRERNSFGQNAVLGLPTGSTPVGVYRELRRRHREGGLDCASVGTFKLDEYVGIERMRLQS